MRLYYLPVLRAISVRHGLFQIPTPFIILARVRITADIVEVYRKGRSINSGHIVISNERNWPLADVLDVGLSWKLKSEIAVWALENVPLIGPRLAILRLRFCRCRGSRLRMQ